MPSLEQQRAILAHTHILEIKRWEEAERKKYGSIVHRLPSLLRSAGLCQALHFVSSRKKDEQKVILDQLAEQLRRIDGRIGDGKALLEVVRGADLSKYLTMTREALACVDWYRRLVQSELGIEAGEQDDDRD